MGPIHPVWGHVLVSSQEYFMRIACRESRGYSRLPAILNEGMYGISASRIFKQSNKAFFMPRRKPEEAAIKLKISKFIDQVDRQGKKQRDA